MTNGAATEHYSNYEIQKANVMSLTLSRYGGTAVGRLRSGFSLRSRLDTAYRRAKLRVQRLTQGRVGLDIADDGEGAERQGVAGISLGSVLYTATVVCMSPH